MVAVGCTVGGAFDERHFRARVSYRCRGEPQTDVIPGAEAQERFNAHYAPNKTQNMPS
jgi:hypothetical protein